MPDSTLAPSGPEGYRLLDMLGKGAYGEVWQAEAPGGVQVAVKILSLTLKPAEAKRELAALHSMLELRHPYLLSLQAIFYHGDRIFVVMELADDSLRARLSSCRAQGQPGIPTAELLRLVREAAEAIDYLHENQRLHRDIKPDNVLLLAGHAKVADYGLARILEQRQTVQTQSVLGTPAYMAPEVWEGSVGPRSDQYSLAVAYVELRCGRRPFDGRSMPQLAKQHAEAAPDLSGIPEGERSVVAKGLAKRSADRYPTCREFVADLGRAVQAEAARQKAFLAARTVAYSVTEKVKEKRRPADPIRKKSAGGGKAVVLGAVVLLPLLFCGLCGSFAYFGWPRGGAVTQPLFAGSRSTESERGGSKPGNSRQVSSKRASNGTVPTTSRKDTKKEPPFGSNLRGGDIAEVKIADGVTMMFCWIPPGEATLGSPTKERGHSSHEQEHAYTSRGFWLAKYPVTQGQWKAVMGNNPSFYTPAQEEVKKVGITDTSRFPVERVCWDDPKDKDHSAQEFLRKLNVSVKMPAPMGRGRFALPHEDEWEYAYRGGRGNKQPFYWGYKLNGDLANCNGNYPYGTPTKGEYKYRTTQVGDYEKVAPHPWGLCDMSGNVSQWCDDCYDKDNNSRVLRGGSWIDIPVLCRAAFRTKRDPGNRYSFIGFRPCFRPD